MKPNQQASSFPPSDAPTRYDMDQFVERIANLESFPPTFELGSIETRMHLLRDDDGWSSLDHAVADGSMIAFDRLLFLGADPFMPDEDGINLLAISCAQGEPEMTRRLLGMGFPVDSATISEGSTPLMLAARCNNVDCALLLIEAGADMDLLDFEGNDARVYADGEPFLAFLGEQRALREARAIGSDLSPAPNSCRKPSL